MKNVRDESSETEDSRVRHRESRFRNNGTNYAITKVRKPLHLSFEFGLDAGCVEVRELIND